jgi:23S rRNA (uracil1939-C5)-methyltransferase
MTAVSRTAHTAHLKPGDVVELDIEKAVYRGLGLARHEGQVVFVPRAIAGDRVRARVESVTPGYVRAVPEAVVRSAAERRAPPCPLFTRCGGCAYQDVDYPAQLRLKEGILRESLSRAGVAWEGEIALVASPEEGWRTRATLHLEEVDGALLLGLHEEGSHRVVDVEACLQLSPAMNQAARALRAALAARGPDARRIHDVEMAESMDGAQLVVCLETDLAVTQAVALAPLADAVPGLTGLGVMAVDARGPRYLHLRGDPHVEAGVRGLRLRSHIRSFFQAHRFLLADLVGEVVAMTPQEGPVLDLYAGVGLFALALAERDDAVLGAELNPTAVEDARANIEASQKTNVRVRQGDVTEALGSWPAAPRESIVLDPPRTGAGAAVVRAVAARRPACVVYVSCDPPTLGRDLAVFAKNGYVPDTLRAFDLFPDTFHLETVVRLLPR